MICNNLSCCHNPDVINEDNNAILVFCKECGDTVRIGKDIKGSPEHRIYSEFFKRELVQPDHPLYYKYAGAKGMHVI